MAKRRGWTKEYRTLQAMPRILFTESKTALRACGHPNVRRGDTVQQRLGGMSVPLADGAMPVQIGFTALYTVVKTTRWDATLLLLSSVEIR